MKIHDPIHEIQPYTMALIDALRQDIEENQGVEEGSSRSLTLDDTVLERVKGIAHHAAGTIKNSILRVFGSHL